MRGWNYPQEIVAPALGCCALRDRPVGAHPAEPPTDTASGFLFMLTVFLDFLDFRRSAEDDEADELMARLANLKS